MANRLDGRKSAEAEGRDSGGRFAKGNPGGPGRPRRATEREYLSAIAEACPPETWHTIVGRAVADAMEGDAKAREWLASYLVGKPELPASSLFRLAVDELRERDYVADTARIETKEGEFTNLLFGGL